ncbi:hypothetical protein RB195_023347 [Necator americanus]|uniref:Reverse transcriptase domain-containing protein n=1 Tax=Necator americanus TaxID=51031 RepID=A0ABR1EIT1_NECAM
MPLCLTFIDLKKVFDSVETEAVVEALDNQGVPTQYIKVLRELYSNFTTGISPFYKNIIIDVERATLENAMRKLEWDDMGVKVDGRQLHHLRFADEIVLIAPSISQAERMLTEFDETCDDQRSLLSDNWSTNVVPSDDEGPSFTLFQAVDVTELGNQRGRLVNRPGSLCGAGAGAEDRSDTWSLDAIASDSEADGGRERTRQV